MKIDNSMKTTAVDAIGGSNSKAESRPKDQRSATAGTDVQLSALSSKLHSLEAAGADAEHIDAAKVESIKRAIAEGRFRVNPEAVADRLLDTVKSLIRSDRDH